MLPKGAVSPRRTLLSLSCTHPFQKALPRKLCPQPYGVGDPLVCSHGPQSLLHLCLFTPCCPGHCNLSLWGSRILRSGMVI